MSRRYFEGSFPRLAERLDEHLARMKERWSGIAARGQALVLGGGYGRGEGGVLESPQGAEFFNDLDYFLFTATPDDPVLVEWCQRAEREETAQLGVDVEIKRLPAADVTAGLETMMFADLVAGHVAVAGDAGFLEPLAARLDFARVGAEDAARLLWNRGSGLYFARGRIEAESDAAFVVRNHAKLKLAMGDALLCLQGAYVPRCRERGRRFETLELPPELEGLRAWHREAVEFKFRPVAPPADRRTLEEESRALAAAWLKVFLQVEARRLQYSGLEIAGYLDLPRVFPQTPAWRNAALALRDRLKRRAALRPWTDYPRGALMRALPCLLELEGHTTGSARRFLPAPAAGESWHTLYQRWWAYYC